MLFQYEARARQLIDYSNLSWGCIHPTDIDGCLEFSGKKLVLLEYKTAGKEVDKGQELLLERIANNWIKSCQGNSAIVIVADHYTNADEVVDGGKAIVRMVYHKHKWYDYNNYKRTVKSVVENYAKDEIERRINGK